MHQMHKQVRTMSSVVQGRLRLEQAIVLSSAVHDAGN
jgi:hypothetical protein